MDCSKSGTFHEIDSVSFYDMGSIYFLVDEHGGLAWHFQCD